MSLQRWLQNSWLVQHTTSPEEIANLLALSDRDLAACQVDELPADWRFVSAYNAGLQAATAALAAVGYRATRDNHHYNHEDVGQVQLPAFDFSQPFRVRGEVISDLPHCRILKFLYHDD